MVFVKLVAFGTFANCECNWILSLPSEDISAKVNAEHFTDCWNRGWSQTTVPHGKKPNAHLKGDTVYSARSCCCDKPPRNVWRKDNVV